MTTERLPLDADAASQQGAPNDRLPTEGSRIALAWFVFGSLVVGVLSVGAMIGAVFP